MPFPNIARWLNVATPAGTQKENTVAKSSFSPSDMRNFHLYSRKTRKTQKTKPNGSTHGCKETRRARKMGGTSTQIWLDGGTVLVLTTSHRVRICTSEGRLQYEMEITHLGIRITIWPVIRIGYTIIRALQGCFIETWLKKQSRALREHQRMKN